MSTTFDYSHIDFATFDFEGFLADFEVLDDIVLDTSSTKAIDDVDSEKWKKPLKSKTIKKVVKSLKRPATKVGGKFEITTTTTTQLKLSTYEDHFQVVAPNMSLKTTDYTLYAFPRFNKCDALLYFPSTMASFINSGDMSSLSELFGSYLHNSCPINMTDSLTTTYRPSIFLNLVDKMNDICPDMIMCMHFTKLVDSEIHSKLYFKFTDNPVLYAAMSRALAGTPFAHMFPPTRTEQFEQKFRASCQSEEEVDRYIALLDSEHDVQVYGTIAMRICINEHTKRVTELNFINEITSLKRC